MNEPNVLATLFWAAVILYGIARLILAAIDNLDAPVDPDAYR